MDTGQLFTSQPDPICVSYFDLTRLMLLCSCDDNKYDWWKSTDLLHHPRYYYIPPGQSTTKKRVWKILVRDWHPVARKRLHWLMHRFLCQFSARSWTETNHESLEDRRRTSTLQRRRGCLRHLDGLVSK